MPLGRLGTRHYRSIFYYEVFATDKTKPIKILNQYKNTLIIHFIKQKITKVDISSNIKKVLQKGPFCSHMSNFLDPYKWVKREVLWRHIKGHF